MVIIGIPLQKQRYHKGYFDTNIYKMVILIGSSQFHINGFLYNTQVLIDHVSNTGGVFQCLASEN